MRKVLPLIVCLFMFFSFCGVGSAFGAGNPFQLPSTISEPEKVPFPSSSSTSVPPLAKPEVKVAPPVTPNPLFDTGEGVFVYVPKGWNTYKNIQAYLDDLGIDVPVNTVDGSKSICCITTSGINIVDVGLENKIYTQKPEELLDDLIFEVLEPFKKTVEDQLASVGKTYTKAQLEVFYGEAFNLLNSGVLTTDQGKKGIYTYLSINLGAQKMYLWVAKVFGSEQTVYLAGTFDKDLEPKAKEITTKIEF